MKSPNSLESEKIATNTTRWGFPVNPMSRYVPLCKMTHEAVSRFFSGTQVGEL
jgi:hypothetical protein